MQEFDEYTLLHADEEITLFKSVGSGVLDIVAARRIYEKAIEMVIGQIIEF